MEDILGFNGTKEESLKIWQKNAERWFSVGSPWRPSRGDIAIYKKLSGNKIAGNVLILGSTPELRDLVALKNNSPVLVDISQAMLQKMGELMKYADLADEIWIKSDWCEASLPKNHFDLIVGDMIWWVVSVNYQSKLRDKIANLLKPDGIFVSRFRLWDIKNAGIDPYETINEYLRRLDASSQNEILLRNAMMSRLYDIFVDNTVKRLNREKVRQFLTRVTLRMDNERYKNFLNEASQRMLSADWTSQTRKEILDIVQKKFILEEESSAKDYNAESYPIMKLIKE